MAQLNINVDCEGTLVSVHDMRRRLAKMLSSLEGDQMVVYSFRASLPFYRPAQPPEPTVIYGELARPEND
jgi:hypothetical protein